MTEPSVWVLMEEEIYEGAFLVGVYDSPEAAMQDNDLGNLEPEIDVSLDGVCYTFWASEKERVCWVLTEWPIKSKVSNTF